MLPPSDADNVKVAVRVRPLNKRENSYPHQSSANFWSITPTSITQYVDSKPNALHSFSFDHIFTPDATNGSVYETVASPLVHSALQGINAVIFAYGQTAAGKTHTMLGNADDPGVTLRCLSQVFQHISAQSARTFRLRASYIEIYNEFIRDLLIPSNDNLKVHQNVATNTVYVDAHNKIVTSLQDVLKIISAGEAVRTIGATNMNEKASRSHTLFTLTIESTEIPQPSSTTAAPTSGVAVRTSTLVLVDLAGSERASSTKAQGTRLTEGGYINKSLLTLGTVIKKLTSEKTNSAAHVPYRDSKLTRLLQPALGGNARTVIICAVTPAILHVDETLSTLKFASRAKHVTNHAETNEFLDDRAKLRRAERQINALKKEMKKLRASVSARSSPQDELMDVSEREKWENHLEKSISRLIAQMQKMRDECPNCLLPKSTHHTLDNDDKRQLLQTLTENSPQRIQAFGMTEQTGALSKLSDAVKQLQHQLGEKQIELDNVEPLVIHEEGTSLFENGASKVTISDHEYGCKRSSSTCTIDDSLTENSFDSSMNSDISDSSTSSQASSAAETFRELRDSFEEKKFELDMLFRRLEALKSEMVCRTDEVKSCETSSDHTTRSEKGPLVEVDGENASQTQRDTTEQEVGQAVVSNVQVVKPGLRSEIIADDKDDEEFCKERRKQNSPTLIDESTANGRRRDYDSCGMEQGEYTVSEASRKQSRLAKVAVVVRRVILASCALWFHFSVSRLVNCGRNGSFVGLCVGNVTECSPI